MKELSDKEGDKLLGGSEKNFKVLDGGKRVIMRGEDTGLIHSYKAPFDVRKYISFNPGIA